MKFSGICLLTDDLPGLVKFYESVFGTQAEGDDHHAEIRIGESNFAFFTKRGMEKMVQGSMRESGFGGFTMGFEVENVDDEYERLKGLNVTFVMLPTDHPWGIGPFGFVTQMGI